MKKNKSAYNILFLIISIQILLIMSGCNIINLNKTEPEKTFFSFNDLKQSKLVQKHKNLFSNLVLLDFTSSEDFKGTQFIYKNKNRYIKDYYNRFFYPPENMIKKRCAKWFNTTKLKLKYSDIVLKGEVLEIFCDRTGHNDPLAKISIRFSLVEYNKEDRILFKKDISSGVKFNHFTPDNLVNAWTDCLENIFTDLESDILSAI